MSSCVLTLMNYFHRLISSVISRHVLLLLRVEFLNEAVLIFFFFEVPNSGP
jgi:hypothetical protein